MFVPPLSLQAVELRQRLEGGRTEPWLVVAEDEAARRIKVVLKLRRPGRAVGDGHFGGTSLACELVAAAIAKVVGLQVPASAIVVVGREFVDAIPQRQHRELFSRNIGEHFGSEFVRSQGLWRPQAAVTSGSLLDQLEDLIAFDAAVLNGDRKSEKPNLLYRGDVVVPIDHSLALPVHTGSDEAVAESPLFPDEQVARHCAAQNLRGTRRHYVRAYDEWATRIDDGFLSDLRAMIPTTWQERPGDIDKIFSFLSSRPKRFQALTQTLVRLLQ